MTATDSAAAAGKLERLFVRWRDHGDGRALAALFDETAPDLFRIALSVAPDAATAEEAVQETFLAILEDPSGCDPSRPLMPWLATVLRHKTIDARRRERRVPDPLRLEPRILSEDPADAAERRDAVDRVRAAMQRLPEPYRSVALLRWEYGLEPGEIAHARGEPPGTVRSLLSRSLDKLREALGGGAALALVLGFRPPQGLASIRRAVLERAGVPVAAGGLAVAGVMISKTAAAIVVATAFGTGVAATGVAWSIAAPDPVDAVATHPAAVSSSSVRGPRRPANEGPRATPPVDPAPRSDSSVSAPPLGPTSEQEVRAEAGRLLDTLSDSWIEGWRVGSALSRLRPAEAVLDVLRARWPEIESGVARQNVLKGFSYDSSCEFRLDVFDLGMRDADPRVQDFALSYFEDYAGRPFLDDPAACAAWREASRGRTPEELLDAAGARLLRAIHDAPPQARAALLGILADTVDKRRTPALRDAVLSALSVWIEDPSWLAVPAPLLRLAANARPSETWKRAEFDELLARGGECGRRALLLAGRLRHAPAFPALVAGLRSPDPGTVVAAARGLASLDDRAALGPLVEALRGPLDAQAQAAAVCALEDLTMIDPWKGQDRAWWIAWWERNAGRYEEFSRKERAR